MSPPSNEEVESEEDEQDDDEQAVTCGACGNDYAVDEFLIFCYVCKRCFHGKCVKITAAKAEHKKHYRCPRSISKWARVQM